MRSVAELMDLTGRVAVITGGAGYLGRTMADALAEQGCALCLVDRNAEAGKTVADELRSKHDVDVEYTTVELESETERDALVDDIVKRFGHVDVLVNNAGFVGDSALQGWVVPFEQQRIDTWRRAIEVNLTAAFHLSQRLAPTLAASGKGAIVNISSIYGVAGPDLRLYEGTAMGNPAAYPASKGGLVQMTRWLSSVMAPAVRVNCISPGGIARNQPQTFTERYIDRTPLRRMGSEEDFKGAVVYFASDLSAWVTGENLMIDGGWTVW